MVFISSAEPALSSVNKSLCCSGALSAVCNRPIICGIKVSAGGQKPPTKAVRLPDCTLKKRQKHTE